jgi:hypothetical protein
MLAENKRGNREWIFHTDEGPIDLREEPILK